VASCVCMEGGQAEECRIIFGPYPVAWTNLHRGRAFRKTTIEQVDTIATKSPLDLTRSGGSPSFSVQLDGIERQV